MRQFEVSEIFMSLEGEAQYANYPTVYTRFARCNFSCAAYNNPEREIDTKGYAPLTFKPKDYSTLQSLPPITKGCDSQYAVNPEFSHIWEKMTAEQISDKMIELIPVHAWQHPITGMDYICSITGGEPLLQWKFLPEVLFHPKMDKCMHIIFETNGAVPAKQEFFDNVAKWVAAVPGRKWTWSVSPKLSASGECWDKAIKKDIIDMMVATQGTEIYLKFVAEPTEKDFAEIEKARNALEFTGPVWIMPMACTQEQQELIDQQIAVLCMERGYRLSYRIQNALWGNGVGT